MGAPPVFAKVTVPEVAGDYPRERLFEALDEARSRPLLWVSGPGGAGKTHLLASYIRNRGVDAVWYHTDRGDTDAASFYHYLGIAAKELTRGHSDLPAISSHGDHGDLNRFTFRFFEALFHLMPDDSLLVLDNIQEVHENAPLYSMILDAVSRLPEKINLVVISRNEPPPIMSHLLAARMMRVFDWSEICFTPEEFLQTGRVLGGAECSPSEMETLHRELEGWVAGLVLTLEQARRSGRMPQKLPAGTPRDIVDFFAGQIWKVLDAETQEFLMKTSFFPYMTGEMAGELTGDPTAEARLARLCDYNFFTLRFEPGPRYRYHNLFREYLTQRLVETMPYDEIVWLKKNAAALLYQEGHPEESAKLLVEEKDWEGLNSLLRQAAPDLYGQGRFITIRGWIKRVPQRVRSGYPWFLYWEASCMPFADSEGRLALFSRASELFEQNGDHEGRLLAWAGKVLTYLHRQRSLNELDGLMDDFSALERLFRTVDNRHIRHQVATSMFLALTFRRPSHPEALKWEGLARESIEPDLDPNTTAAFYLTSALRWYFTGNVTMFRSALDDFSNSVEDLDSLLPQHRALLQTLRSIQSWLHFELDECLTYAREGLGFSDKKGGTIWDGLLLGQEINTYLSTGDMPEARKCLELYSSFTDRLPPLSVSYYHQRMAWYCLACGSLEEALENVLEGCRHALLAGIPNNLAYTLIVSAEVFLSIGQYKEAGEALEEAWTRARDLGNELMYFQCGLLEARLSDARGEDAAGDRHLAQALRIGRRKGIRNWQFLTREGVTHLLVTALKRDIEPRYVTELITLWDIQPSGELLDLETWPWPVRIYTLGRFEIFCRGEPLTFEGKVQQRPLELLKAVIALGGEGVAAERIVEVLWPDSPGDAGQRTLETNLLRLRRLLGFKEAVQMKGGRVTLDPKHCWVDLWAFERAASSRDGVLTADDCCVLKKASRLYRGSFLPNDDTHGWTVAARDRLKNRYLRLVERCGSFLEGTGEYEGAIQCYLNAVDLCPLSENLYRKLMLCYEKTGRKGEAMSTYQRCHQVLSNVYGMEPSKSTRELRDRLMT